MDNYSQYLALNLTDIRKRRNLTQSQLAKLVNLPRSTIANLESGTGNPSLQILTQLSVTLQSSIDQLLAPQRASTHLVKANETPVQERAQGFVKIYKLLPDKFATMDIDRMELEPGYSFKGIPHAPGTKEYLHCVQGELSVKVSDGEFVLKKGDTLAFPGHAHHTYSNKGKTVAIGFSVVLIEPLQS